MGNSCLRGRCGVLNDGFLQTDSNSKTNHDFSVAESVIPTFNIIIQPPEEVRIVREEEARIDGEEEAEAEANPTQTEETKPKNSVQEHQKVEGPAIVRPQVLQTKTANLKEHYSLGKKLGDGRFGTIFLCIEKATGKQYACKSILKTTLRTIEDVEDVRREIQIMHILAGNSNVVAIKGAYEDSVAVHLVMELCRGGELYDRLIKNGHCPEKKAAQLARTIVGVVESCHSLGIMHRDLKPENFLFVNDEEDSPLKAIDFGLSTMFKPGETLTELVGSLLYIAPEVLRKNYGPEADVWSAGVMIYVLLSGLLPFFAEKDPELCAEVLYGSPNFSSDPWPSISDSAKDLVKKMLVKDAKKRPTASQVLSHPWLQIDGIAPEKPLDSAVLTKLKQFSAMNKLKKKALRVIAESLSDDEISGLTEIFKTMDTNQIGQITTQDLKDWLRSTDADHDEAEIDDFLLAADFDNPGTIEYSEFIAATVHLNEIKSEDHLLTAFAYLDKDGSGFITRRDLELEVACEEFEIKNAHWEEMIREFDQNNDGQIDYSEFVAMMKEEKAGLS